MAENPKSFIWFFVVFGICIVQPCVTLKLCNNHTECPANIPYCCGYIIGHCKENCNGIPCKSDKNCADRECCNKLSTCTYGRCRDQCSTVKDCPKGQFCCTQRGSKSDNFNVCDDTCFGKHCMADVDCARTECCRDGWCHDSKDCKDREELSITALVIIVVTVVLAIVATVFCVMACFGCFKRRRFGGAIVNDPPDQEEPTVTTDYIQLDDMTVHEPTDE